MINQWENKYVRQQAMKLARWLIEDKGKNKKTAYIIAAKKYKLQDWHEVQRLYNLYRMSLQQKLFEEQK